MVVITNDGALSALFASKILSRNAPLERLIKNEQKNSMLKIYELNLPIGSSSFWNITIFDGDKMITPMEGCHFRYTYTIENNTDHVW